MMVNGQPLQKKSFNLATVLLIAWAILLVANLFTMGREFKEIPYSQFLAKLNAGEVGDVVITDNRIQWKTKVPQGQTPETFYAYRVDDNLATLLQSHNITFSQNFESNWLGTLLSWVLPAIIFVSVWMFFMRRMQGGLSGGLSALGKSRAKIYVERDTKVTFKDVAGVDEAKLELEEIVGFLKDPKKFERLGAHVARGLLLVGPPGTGKTLLARAVAGEAGVPFFSISGSEFVEMLVGLGAARVRNLFETARDKAPCIIFIDELDALGRSRHSQIQTGHDEKEQTLNQLLVELDGFDSHTGIVVLAATNRPEILDPALLRSGRFDRQIIVGRPDRNERLAILKVHAKKIKLGDSVKLDHVAALTTGFTGADLENLINEAALVATRRGADWVEMRDFTAGFERLVAGLEKRNRIMNPLEKKVIAYHELGHAFVASAQPGVDPVHKISIIPRSIGALGYTLQRPTDERYVTTEDDMKRRLSVLMGGRAAEMVKFGHLSTGAADDLVKATALAHDMVTRYGMNRALGSVAYETGGNSWLEGSAPSFQSGWPQQHSDKTASDIDHAVKTLIETQLGIAVAILSRNKRLLDEAAQFLIEKETLDDGELNALLRRVRPLEAHAQGQEKQKRPQETESVN